ncbi:hypothetical protein CPB83DRAFT_900037 [Crepidotus variabilis]|uniref:Secreted protein n=1 Tax=Crepidotus variabilis TaxID=179855 RepID=A0A9P6E3S4_9AGAR|nr:hypothetical protein CPB83DRAFT_900037 [Crepidotus variabilis]
MSIAFASGPPEFQVKSLSFTGSGCPSQSTAYFSNNDNTAVTVIFANFVAEAGPSVAETSNNVDCKLTFGAHVPAGYKFGIISARYSGYYSLDDQVTADVITKYYFQGSKASTKASYGGPFSGGDFKHTDKFDLSSTIQSSCGGEISLNVDQEIQISNTRNPDGSGSATTDSLDLNLQWQQC